MTLPVARSSSRTVDDVMVEVEAESWPRAETAISIVAGRRLNDSGASDS